MSKISKIIKRYKFKIRGEINLKRGKIILTSFKSSINQAGIVYIWIKSKRGYKRQPIYIGKTSKTLCDRCKQQSNGFAGYSSTGRKNSGKIKDYLKKGFKIYIYTRLSDTKRILDEVNVSLCEVEEKALIKKVRKWYPLLLINK